MKKVGRTLRAHREIILNYFRGRKEFFQGRNDHSLGKLPEPELTHRFFLRQTQDDKWAMPPDKRQWGAA